MATAAALKALESRSRLSVLRDMVVFVEVGRHENFTRAAKNLAMPLSTVARRIALLEEGLGMLLLERTTRHQRLTADGRRFFERCRHVVDDALSAYDELHEQVHGLMGHIHISMSEELGSEVLAEAIAAFLIEHTKLEVHVDRSTGTALPMRDTDILICTGTPANPSLVMRRIGDLALGLYAAPGYLRSHGLIASRQDLRQHPLLVPASYRGHCEPLLLKEFTIANVDQSNQLRCETIGIVRALAVAERGVALLPPAISSVYVRAGQLIPVLPTWIPARLPILAVTASKLLPMRLQALIEFLGSRLSSYAATVHRPTTTGGPFQALQSAPSAELA